VFLLCWEHDPCYLYLDSIKIRMGIFIECEHGSKTGIDPSTLVCMNDVVELLLKHIYYASINFYI
jgi:hypothetical protein